MKGVCACCGLPLGETYTIYKGVKIHPTCFMVHDKKVEPSPLAEDLKAVSELMNKKGEVSLDEVCDHLLTVHNYGALPTIKSRARVLLHRMETMNVVEETKAKRPFIRFVKVWRRIKPEKEEKDKEPI